MARPSNVPTQWETVSPVPVGWMRQFRYFCMLYDKILRVRGDVVECGLGEGNTFAMLAYLVASENVGSRRTLYGFDSFRGWPEPATCDDSPRRPQKGELRVTSDMVIKRFQESGIHRAFPHLKLQIIPGFFSESLPNFSGTSRIALLHVDCDLYGSYRDVLKYLEPRVMPGGVIALDEYKEFPNSLEYGNGTVEKWPGCTKAVDDHFSGRNEEIRYHSETKKYYIIKGTR